MKKCLVAVALLATVCSAQAQVLGAEEFGIANHVGVGLGVGTDGLTIEAGTCLSKYVQVRAGVNVFPTLSYTDTERFDYSYTVTAGGFSQKFDKSASVDIKGELGWVNGFLKADVYPFPEKSSFFVSVGATIGSDKLLKLSGHSGELADAFREYGRDNVRAALNLDDYKIDFNEKGDIDADVRVNKFRPYLGVGFGRMVPKTRCAFRFELGASFWGSPEFYVNGKPWDEKEAVSAENGDVGKALDLVESLTVYPTLKFGITCRIL